jgi:endonuclease/exonuclease/phosphatase family metal-dependent hydrolase
VSGLVARVAGELRPDLLGLMEIGDPSEFDDLRRRLRAAGLDYPFSEYLQGADPTRHLALLSRFPIVEKHSLSEIPLRVGGLTLRSLRGILDVTVEPKPGYRIRLLCVHLKAKREVGEYDASSLRDAESRFLADHVKGILKRDPDARLVVMGDFNETKNAAPLRALFGNPGHPGSLRALPLADTRGETWTEYWGEADVYSRIDYMMVSSRLDQEVDSARSGVARPAFWNQASDHCPVYLSINPTP